MRSFLRVVIVFLVAISMVFGMYFLADSNSRKNAEARSTVTVTKSPATEKQEKRVLLAEIKEGGYQLYQQGKDVIFVSDGDEFRFGDWSRYIGIEPPQMVTNNLDKDPEREVLIRCLSGIAEETGEKLYEIYVLNEIKDEKTGERDFAVTLLSRNTWVKLIDNRVKIEISQLDKCDKAVQVAMSMAYGNINYDRDTGIAKEYTFWFRALQDENGAYRRVKSWSKGVGEYVIESNGPHLYVPIYVYYEDTDEVQEAGYIRAIVSVSDQLDAYIGSHSMSFVPAPEYCLHNQSYTAEKGWKYVEENSTRDSYSVSDRVIDNVEFETAYSQDTDHVVTNFARNDTELNNLSKIEITESYMDLYAKSGFEFNKKAVKKRKFDVNIIDPERADRIYEISYDGKIRKDKDGNEILRINFDKSYDRKNVANIDFKLYS